MKLLRKSTMGLLLLLAGCSMNNPVTRTPLNISGADDYSESSIRKEMAQDKGGITLAEGGESSYVVIYQKDAPPELMAAGEFLADTLNTMVGTSSIKARQEETSFSSHDFVISIGDTEISRGLDLSGVENDGYKLQVIDEVLFIKGIKWQGSKNGVYDFLESKLECMFIRADYDYIPSFPTVKLPPYDEIVNPSMAWRKQFQYEVLQEEWYDRLRLNGTKAKEGYKEGLYAEWGTWCHSFFDFVPPEEYYEEHPEYYSLHNGERVYEAEWFDVTLQTHLCLTNEEVYEIVLKEMRERILAQPDMIYWDFSIMDTPFEVCQCSECRAVNEEAGAGTGTLLKFLNRLARELGPEFPDVMFSTLAYQDCIQVPDGMTVEDNVVIKLCANPGSQGFSYQTGGNRNSDIIRDLIGDWGQVASHVLIWDYVVDFSHLLLPYPNYDVQKANMDFYVDNNIIGVFHQGSRERGDEMADLRSYVLSRQMWDKDIDLEALMKKYLQVNYGPADEYIAEYLETMSRSYIEKGMELNLYDYPRLHRKGYLSRKNIRTYLDLSARALEVTEGMEREQVEKVRMSILYAKIMESSYDFPGKLKAFEEFRTYTEKFGVERHQEVVYISEFYENTFPAIIKNDKTAWVIISLLSLLGFALVLAGVRIFFKIRKTTGLIPAPEKGEMIRKERASLSLPLSHNALPEAEQAIAFLKETGSSFQFPSIGEKTGNGTSLSFKSNLSLEGDAYGLEINGTGIVIEASTPGGFHNGAASLIQYSALKAKVEGEVLSLPGCRISDSPRFSWRGLMLDSSRHFHELETIKRLLDQMALFKLNRFHWHLTDNNGWRIESKLFPKLNSIASRVGRPCELERDGYYTASDIAEITRYARERNIEIIPEIDVPGHAAALLEAYPEYLCPTNKERIPASRRSNNSDYSEIFCAGNDDSLDFLKKVFREALSFFDTAYVHIGGDEVQEGIWSQCPLCRERMKEIGASEEFDLQKWFLTEIARDLKTAGYKVVNWAEKPGKGLPEVSIAQLWRGKSRHHIKETLGQGVPLISSFGEYAYFDYPDRKGTAKSDWMARLSLRQVYSYRIVPFFLKKTHKDMILGGSCTLWTEEILTEDIDAMLFPRLTAFAEQMWSCDRNRNWLNFLYRLRAVKSWLSTSGVQFSRAPKRKDLVQKGVQILTDLGHSRWNYPEYMLQKGDVRAYISKSKPSPGSTVTFLFDSPQTLSRILIVSGGFYVFDEKEGRIKSGALEISRDGHHFEEVSPFDEGFCEAQIPSVPVKAFRIRLDACDGKLVVNRVDFS